MKTRPFLSCLWILLASPAPLLADPPPIISFQGRVTVTGVNFTGAGQFKFALVNGTGSLSYWSNDGSSVAGAQPAAFVPLDVTGGLYSILLGDSAMPGMLSIPPTIFANDDVRIRVWFNDGSHGFQQLSPDRRIAAVGYAFVASSVPDGAITSSKIAAGAVGSAQIANGAVGAAQLAGNVGGFQTFTASGNFTAPANVTVVFVTLVGGGGGGGAGNQVIGIDKYNGGGGGSGGMVINFPVRVTPGSSYPVTIGEAGAGAPPGQTGGNPHWSGHDGSAGGATSFGNLASAAGGSGGKGGTGINQGGGGEGGAGGSTSVSAPFSNMGYTGLTGGGRVAIKASSVAAAPVHPLAGAARVPMAPTPTVPTLQDTAPVAAVGPLQTITTAKVATAAPASP